jgi:hypothetical protein
MTEIEIKEETKLMLEDLATQAQNFHAELQKKNEEQQTLQKKIQELQLEIHGIIKTMKYLLDRAANGKAYNFDPKTFKLITSDLPPAISSNNGDNGRTSSSPEQSGESTTANSSA